MERHIVPHGNDILMGRGGKNNQHVGNEQLRAIARSQTDSYRLSSKKGKSHISREIVAYVRSMDPPGRFLKKDVVTGEWEDVGDDTAREKVSQVLRDAVSASQNSPEGASDEVVAYNMTSIDDNRRSESAPSIVMSTPPAATSSRYGRRYMSSRRASSSDDTRLQMSRSGQRRSYSPSRVVSMDPSYYHSPDRQLHPSDHHHHQQQHYHHHQGQHQHHHQGQHQQAYESAHAFEPPPPRRRNYSAPPAVAPVVSHEEIPLSPILSSAPKKQRRESDRDVAYHRSAYSYAYAAPAPAPAPAAVASSSTAAAAAAAPQGERSAAAAAAEHEDEFDLFDGGLLQNDAHLKTDRSKPDDEGQGPYGGLSSSKTF